MGINASIGFQVPSGTPDIEVFAALDYAAWKYGDTFYVDRRAEDRLWEVSLTERYFSAGYPRGCVPRIVVVIESLRSHLPAETNLWYYGDTWSIFDPPHVPSGATWHASDSMALLAEWIDFDSVGHWSGDPQWTPGDRIWEACIGFDE